MAKKNPLDDSVAAVTTNNLKFGPCPSLYDYVKQNGMTGGFKGYDQAMTRYFQDIERQVNERLQPKTAASDLSTS